MKTLFATLLVCTALVAQVYSPKLLREGQPDTADLTAFANTIYANANARTPRQKAEAIWRFFLTDGRFVEPGFWYHIAGWTYEEPAGELLDPIKLLNSYGFGLCYHTAPLLEATFEAGGFRDARTWFLTGHTVAEVFYEGKYHYYDSDMMGYNVAGEGHFFGKPVLGVRDLERDGNAILGKLSAPNKVKPEAVDQPWYPADVHASAMNSLADLFTSTSDNYLYPETRYSPGHSMNFVLRPGEKLIRFFEPEEPGLFYLPYSFDGKQWTEFPREISEYSIRTSDGPRSQKDPRMWATGRIEYTPESLPPGDVVSIEMPSPYVVIDARFSIDAQIPSASALVVETSINGGVSWQPAGEIRGPFTGDWQGEPQILVKSEHGRFTAVSGSYGYLVRITKRGQSQIRATHFLSRIQLNPRSLPSLQPGRSLFHFSAAAPVRRIVKIAPLHAAPVNGLRLVAENGQGFLLPVDGRSGEALYVLDADGAAITGFEAGARFLNLHNHLAPDKLTAETRHTAITTREGVSSIAWSLSPDGPFHTVYQSAAKLSWLDGDVIDRLLLWPEVFRQVDGLPAATKRLYVRIASAGPAIDNVRLALYAEAPPPSGELAITQVWHEGNERREHVESLQAGQRDKDFSIQAGSTVHNDSITFSLVHVR